MFPVERSPGMLLLDSVFSAVVVDVVKELEVGDALVGAIGAATLDVVDELERAVDGFVREDDILGEIDLPFVLPFV